MSEYLFSDEITTFALNMETGAWRIVGVDSRLGAKYFWYEADTNELQTSALGKVYLLERAGETADGAVPIWFEVETSGRALPVGQVGVVQRVYIDVNTRGEALTPRLVIDGGDVVDLPMVVSTTKRQVIEIPAGNVPARIVGVRLFGHITKRVELFEIACDVSVGEQEHQLSPGAGA